MSVITMYGGVEGDRSNRNRDRNGNRNFSLSKEERDDWGKWAKYYVNEDKFTDYAPYGRNKNGTPFNKEGRPIGGGSFDTTGFDPTGRSDLRRYEDTIISRDEWNHLGRGYDKYVNSKGGYDNDDRDSYSPSERPYNPQTGGDSSYGSYDSYGSQLAALRRARKKAIENAVDGMESQRGNVNKSYDDIAAMAYAQKMKNQRKLESTNSQLATGTADSLNLQEKLNYQNALLGNEQKRNEAMKSIDKDIANIKTTGEAAIAEDAEKYALLARQERQRQEEEAYKRKLYDLERQDKLEERDYNRALQERMLQSKSQNFDKPTDNGKLLDNLWSQYSYYDEIGKQNEANSILSRINELNGLNGEFDSNNVREKIKNEVLNKPLSEYGYELNLGHDKAAFGNSRVVAENVKQMVAQGRSDAEITKYIMSMGLRPETFF